MNTVIGYKIKQYRTQKGLSQEAVAEYLNIAQSTYARIENGETNSWSNYITPLSSLFGIQPEELLKQENIRVDKIENKGNAIAINTGVIYQLTEELKNQFKENAKLKDDIITDLRARLAKYEN